GREGEEGTAKPRRILRDRGRDRRPQRIGLKAQEKRRLQPRGECVPEPPAMTNAHATIYDKDMRKAFTRTHPHISGEYYSSMTHCVAGDDDRGLKPDGHAAARPE